MFSKMDLRASYTGFTKLLKKKAVVVQYLILSPLIISNDLYAANWRNLGDGKCLEYPLCICKDED